MVSVHIHKLDRPKGLKHLRDIIRSQGIGQASDVESMVRDRSMLVGIDVKTRRKGETCAQWWEFGRILSLRSLSFSLSLLTFPLARFQPTHISKRGRRMTDDG